jgi:hypothetical protein
MLFIKNEIQKILDNMPDKFDSEELMYALFLLEKIKTSEREIQNYELMNHSEIIGRAESWLKA